MSSDQPAVASSSRRGRSHSYRFCGLFFSTPSGRSQPVSAREARDRGGHWRGGRRATMDFDFGAALPGAALLYPVQLVRSGSNAPAAPQAAAAADDGSHWEAHAVAWDPAAMVAWPAGSAAPAEPIAGAPPAAPARLATVCCQVPGCTESSEAMRDYNLRCRCADEMRLYYARFDL